MQKGLLQSSEGSYDNLKSTHAELSRQLAAINDELKPMKDIRRWVGKVISPEQAEVGSKPEPKQSITEKMQYYQDKEMGERRRWQKRWNRRC